jgi:hypothetical protein
VIFTRGHLFERDVFGSRDETRFCDSFLLAVAELAVLAESPRVQLATLCNE